MSSEADDALLLVSQRTPAMRPPFASDHHLKRQASRDDPLSMALHTTSASVVGSHNHHLLPHERALQVSNRTLQVDAEVTGETRVRAKALEFDFFPPSQCHISLLIPLLIYLVLWRHRMERRSIVDQ